MLHQPLSSPHRQSLSRKTFPVNDALLFQVYSKVWSLTTFSPHNHFVINKNAVQLFQKSKWTVSSLPLALTHVPIYHSRLTVH